MNAGETITVHQLGIARPSGSGPLQLYAATCSRCGAIIEQGKAPLSIGFPGLYAVRGAGTESSDVWVVAEPFPHFMVFCNKLEAALMV